MGIEREFRRVAVVNRGQVAMRFVHSVREFNREHGTDLTTIALYTDPDRGARYVREADEATSLGVSSFLDPQTGRRKSRYVDLPHVREVLARAKVEAVWVGWGYVPEHIAFAEMCAEAGFRYLGPSLTALRRLGDKIATKRLAAELDIPVVPWSESETTTHEAAREAAERLGYPVMVKSAMGGAGRILAAAEGPGALAIGFSRVREEAARVLGDPRCFVERQLQGTRLVAVHVLADAHGTVWDVGVREGTVQHAFGKMLDEAPAPALSAALERRLRTWAVSIARAAAYEGAGTVEFLVDVREDRAFLLEVNPRLETAHDVLEATTGIDLVKHQILVARGAKLLGAAPPQQGHAFEVRVRAEDPARAFAPAPGVIDAFRPPTGPGIRVEASVVDGDEVPPGLSTMIAKLVAYGRTRTEALTRMERALRDTVVVLRGGATNKSYLLSLLGRDEVRAGAVDVAWLDRLEATGALETRPHADVAIVAAAIELADAETDQLREAFLVAAARGRPTLAPEIGRRVELRYRGQSYALEVAKIGDGAYSVHAFGRKRTVLCRRQGSFERRLSLLDDDRAWAREPGAASGRRAVVVADELGYTVEVDGAEHRVFRDDGGVVRAPAPGIVQSIAVRAGEVVSRGAPLLVIEAMKMEMTIAAPFSGRVRDLHAVSNVPIATGAPLLFLEGAGSAPAGTSSERVAFAAPSTAARPAPREAWLGALAQLRSLALGYDVDAADVKRLVAECQALAKDPACARDPEIARAEHALLLAVVDVASLFRRRQGDDAGGDEDLSAEEYLTTFLRTRDPKAGRVPEAFFAELAQALAHYGVTELSRSVAVDDALFRIFKAHQRVDQVLAPVVQILERWLASDAPVAWLGGTAELLDRLARATRVRHRTVSDLTTELSYRLFARPAFEEARAKAFEAASRDLGVLGGSSDGAARRAAATALIASPYPLTELIASRLELAEDSAREAMLGILGARYYRTHGVSGFSPLSLEGAAAVVGEFRAGAETFRLALTYATAERLPDVLSALARRLSSEPPRPAVLDVVVRAKAAGSPAALSASLVAALNASGLAPLVRRVSAVFTTGPSDAPSSTRPVTFVPGPDGFVEDALYRGLHPMLAERLRLSQLSEFTIERLPSADDVFLFRGVAHKNPKDERLFAFAEVRDLTPVLGEDGKVVGFPYFERLFQETLASIRLVQSKRSASKRLHWNRVEFQLWPTLELSRNDVLRLCEKMAPATGGLGLEKVVLRATLRDPKTGEERGREVHVSKPTGMTLRMEERELSDAPLPPMSEYEQKVVRLRQRGLTYPLEVVRMLAPAPGEVSVGGFPPGDFRELDLVGDELLPLCRPRGRNTANIIVGLIRNFTARYPEGVERVVLLGDPSKNLGALAEPECRRIMAAIDLAEKKQIPLEWFALSSGAKIAMDSGTENMDWIADVLRRLIEFTQGGGEVNILVMGINVGAQPYWNAEATMLMHTRGILVMMPHSAMVLTGKRALDYSGGLSAEDDQGIGGYDRIMGVNGQGQYFARDVEGACRILLAHYEHSYVAPGERFPRRAVTSDPIDRDVCQSPHGDGFATVGDIFSDQKNPGRKKPFHIRRVMSAAIDHDHAPLERWADMKDAEVAVVWDAHIGGWPVCLIGIESEPIKRQPPIPADGPEQWTGGTLFPLASKKVARAVNAASGSRPLVILANLSGFDGSPESMRSCQLEFGAEIGRAVVNFRGPIVFTVVSRFHGGAYVVFSRTLNKNLEVTALEGTYASVIGGAPAAGVVFAGEVEARAQADARVKELEARIAAVTDDPGGAQRRKLRADLEELLRLVRAEKVGEMAEEFDHEHSVQRALRVGSLHRIIPAHTLRPYLVDAIERGMAREMERLAGAK